MSDINLELLMTQLVEYNLKVEALEKKFDDINEWKQKETMLLELFKGQIANLTTLFHTTNNILGEYTLKHNELQLGFDRHVQCMHGECSEMTEKMELCKECLYKNNFDDNTCGACKPNSPQSRFKQKGSGYENSRDSSMEGGESIHIASPTDSKYPESKYYEYEENGRKIRTRKKRPDLLDDVLYRYQDKITPEYTIPECCKALDAFFKPKEAEPEKDSEGEKARSLKIGLQNVVKASLNESGGDVGSNPTENSKLPVPADMADLDELERRIRPESMERADCLFWTPIHRCNHYNERLNTGNLNCRVCGIYKPTEPEIIGIVKEIEGDIAKVVLYPSTITDTKGKVWIHPEIMKNVLIEEFLVDLKEKMPYKWSKEYIEKWQGRLKK